MFVLGIDPGLSRCGYGLVRRTTSGALRASVAGVIETDPQAALPERLRLLQSELRALIGEHRPGTVVVERVFFQVNARTAMSVGQASGLALAEAAAAGCEVAQYTANEVKQAVVGYGAATKEQVQRMVTSLLGLTEVPRPPDVADALALAACHITTLPLRRALMAAGQRSSILGGGRSIPNATPRATGNSTSITGTDQVHATQVASVAPSVAPSVVASVAPSVAPGEPR